MWDIQKRNVHHLCHEKAEESQTGFLQFMERNVFCIPIKLHHDPERVKDDIIKNEETIKTFKCVRFLIDRTKNISRCFLYTFLKVNQFLQLLKVLGFFWSSHTIDFKPILPLGSLKPSYSKECTGELGI